jgi:Protein of unknown function (DUF3108)
MPSFRPALYPLVLTLMLLAAPVSARAQGKLDAQYLVTVAGMPIGKGRWLVDITEDRFSAAASGAAAGLLRLFASGDGTSVAQGMMVAGMPVATGFMATVNTAKTKEEFRVRMEAGEAKEFSVLPPPPPDNARVPLTDAHRRGVKDPMTASLIAVPGKGSVLGPQACPNNVSVFDGRYRFDIQLAFKRIDQIKADKGYSGATVVCGITFVPVAGHVPDKPGIKYVTSLHDMELWLAPIAGTRVVVPFRVSVPTPLGLGIMQATEFVSAASPRATTASAKPQ